MTKDKLLITLQISSLITAIIDLAFIIFVIVSYALLWAGVIFVQAYFSSIALTAIIINAVFLLILGVYLIFRKK